jgi:hypothetical protein
MTAHNIIPRFAATAIETMGPRTFVEARVERVNGWTAYKRLPTTSGIPPSAPLHSPGSPLTASEAILTNYRLDDSEIDESARESDTGAENDPADDDDRLVRYPGICMRRPSWDQAPTHGTNRSTKCLLHFYLW